MKYLVFFSLLMTAVIAQAQFTFVTNADNTVTITQYTGTNDVVVIPDNLGGLTVTEIGLDAFYGSSIASVTLPDSVINIDDFAFESCADLTNVVMGSGLASIGDLAFSECTSLTTVSLPPTLTYLGQNAFGGCTSLGSITIPDGVGAIEPNTFLGCMALTNVVLPLTVTNIENDAFFGCSRLPNIAIPENVISIVSDAFNDCTNLAAINVDSRNQYLSSLSGVVFNPGQSILLLCPPGKSGSYTVPDSVTNISGESFYDCSHLASVTIPDSVTTIGDAAFSGCLDLSSVSIGNSVANVGIYVFQDCYRLTSVSIPPSLTTIGFYMFSYCIGLTNVTIPDTVTNIGTGAFLDCFSLVDIDIPNSVTSIGEDAFNTCTHLTQISFSGNAPSLGNDTAVFGYDTNATVYYLPGTTGWNTTFNGRPTAQWFLPNPTILNFEPSFGILTNMFGFTVSWATNASIVVDAATNLAAPNWQPVLTNALSAGTTYFTDPQWKSVPGCFYRVHPL